VIKFLLLLILLVLCWRVALIAVALWLLVALASLMLWVRTARLVVRRTTRISPWSSSATGT